MRGKASQRAGFTLFEVLLAVLVVSILVAVVLPSADPTLQDELRMAADVVCADLNYARSLAVSNTSCYRLQFDLVANSYTLQHTGTNTSLDLLPPAPWGDRQPATTQTTRLADLPASRSGARLYAVALGGSGYTTTTEIEFCTLGQTKASRPSVVWLAAGQGAATRYVTISVNPVTGLASTGPISSALPPI